MDRQNSDPDYIPPRRATAEPGLKDEELTVGQSPRTATVEEFRSDPGAVIDQAFEFGEVIVTGPAPEDEIRFATQSYDIDPDNVEPDRIHTVAESWTPASALPLVCFMMAITLAIMLLYAVK